MSLSHRCSSVRCYSLWLPSELAPLEDTGWFTTHVSAPEGSTLDYTDGYTKESERILSQIPELDSYYSVVARGWRPTLVNHAVTWVTLKDWSERRRPQHEIVAEVQPDLSEIPGATAFAFTPPPFIIKKKQMPVQTRIRGPSYEVLDGDGAQIRADLVHHPMVTNFESDLDLTSPSCG